MKKRLVFIFVAICILVVAVAFMMQVQKNDQSNLESVKSAVANELPEVQIKDAEPESSKELFAGPAQYYMVELRTEIDIPLGWKLSKNTSSDLVSYNMTNPESPLELRAIVSRAPVGFSSCVDNTEIQKLNIRTLRRTKSEGIVIYQDSLSKAVSLAKESSEYASRERSLTSPEVALSAQQVGDTLYICRSSHAPISWSIDFDKDPSTNDGITFFNSKTPEAEPSEADPGYQDLIKVLTEIRIK